MGLRPEGLLGAVVSGLMLGSTLGFSPESAWPLLVWVALVPLLLRLETGMTLPRFFFEAWLMLWVMQAVTLGRTFEIHPGWSLLIVTVQASLMSPVFAVHGLLHRKLGRRMALLGLPACFTAWEWFITLQPLHLSTPLGATQADFYPLIQFYDVAGVWGGTFWIVVCNVLVLEIVHLGRTRRDAWGRIAAHVLATLTLVGLPPLAYSAWVFFHEETQAPARIQVGLIQAGERRPPNLHPLVQATQLSAEALGHGPDLLVWPETTLLRDLGQTINRGHWRELYAWIDASDVPVLSGMLDVDRTAAELRHFNTATLITPQLAALALNLADSQPEGPLPLSRVYQKRKLFPLTERIPFADVFPVLRAAYSVMPGEPTFGFEPGNAPEVFAFLDRKGIKHQVGAFICYEALFPQITADLVRAGADVLVTVSSDLRLQPRARWVTAAHTRIRAIETRHAIARVSTVGHSLIVDAYGRVTTQLPMDEPMAATGEMQLGHALTPYVRWNDWLPRACAVFAVVLLCGCALRRFANGA